MTDVAVRLLPVQTLQMNSNMGTVDGRLSTGHCWTPPLIFNQQHLMIMLREYEEEIPHHKNRLVSEFLTSSFRVQGWA